MRSNTIVTRGFGRANRIVTRGYGLIRLLLGKVLKLYSMTKSVLRIRSGNGC